MTYDMAERLEDLEYLEDYTPQVEKIITTRDLHVGDKH